MQLTFDSDELYEKIETCEQLYENATRGLVKLSPVHHSAYQHILSIKTRLETYKPTTVSLDDHDIEAMERLWSI